MALQPLPGLTGFQVKQVSSNDHRAVGKFTDTNHLHSFHKTDPEDYDKKIISLYTQVGLRANDFLNMVNDTTPFYLKEGDSWKWDVEVPFKYAKIIDLPSETANQAKIGIDGQPFTFVMDTNEFAMHSIIGSNRMHSPHFYILFDPTPTTGTGWLYTATLLSTSPKTDFVNKLWLQPGIEYELVDGSIGEFDQELLGLGRLGDKITMMDTLGSAIGFEHTITGWAADKTFGLKAPRSSNGNPLDIVVYVNERNNERGINKNDIRWEPWIEMMMRQKILDLKVKRAIYGKPGTTQSRGTKQEIKKVSAGIIHRMRTSSNYFTYPRGGFKPVYFRTIFGDLFYRREDIQDRKVRVFTNEAGFEVFNQAMKEEAMSAGFTFNVGDGNRFIQGSGQNLVMNYAFNGMVTRETGPISLTHLKELDLPDLNTEYGQNKKSSPIFLVFDVSPSSDGKFGANVREVRLEGRPPMKWGYQDGRTSHLGPKASQGHIISTMFDGYKIFMEDRADIFIEDLSRCFLIEESPFY